MSILDGNQEGLYLWTSLNFMTNRMPIPNTVGRRNPNVLSRTVGTLDLGGGSTQITFAPTDSLVLAHAPPGYVTEVRTGRSIPPAQAQIGSEVNMCYWIVRYVTSVSLSVIICSCTTVTVLLRRKLFRSRNLC